MSESIQQAFLVVSKELGKTVNQARVLLEDAVEGRNPRQALERCAAHLHEAGGVLKLVEVYGGALLTEEMELVCRFMLQPNQDKKVLADSLEALTRAMVQLPAYLERLLAGGRDIALVLLPMLNDLRAVRGQPLLSESTILLLNRTPQRDVTLARRGADPSEDFVVLSRKIRPAFQLALLGLLKADGDSARSYLARLENMALAFEKAASRDDVYRLWWVVGGVLEALLDGSLELSVSIKRLLGQADRRIKRVIDAGLEVFDQEPVTDLINSLLYYVARAESAGPRVQAIREAFALTDALPGAAQVESAREELAAPSVALMETVAAAIRDDLAAVKDVLDIHVRTGEQDLTKLKPQIDLLRKISDTLGVLGLGELRADVLAETDRLQAFVNGDAASADPDTLLAIASTLLTVESSMQRRLTQLVRPKSADNDDAQSAASSDEDLAETRQAVMRECIVNLARIKETLSQAMIGKVDRVAVDATPMLVDGILSGFRILELDKAVAVFDRLARFITAYLNAANHTLASDHQDRLADALVSIEYYMETIEAGRKEPAYMLDNAESCLLVLDEVRAGLEQRQSESYLVQGTQVLEAVDVGVAEHERTATLADDTEIINAPVVSAADAKIDPELLELFIEEAKEEVQTIQRLLPRWQASTADVDSLITVRRSFHTLKGSGRMVGAERIGEYSWHIEDLLNRVINRTLAVTPAMADFVVEAASAVPQLIEQLEIGTEPQADIGLLTAKAIAFAEGDPMAAELTRESVMSGQQAPDMDPVLHEIFAKEAGGYIESIEQFIADIEPAAYPASISDTLHRACHTLHGSINTASVERAAPLSGALNQMIRRLYDSGTGLDEEGVQLLQRSTAAIKAIIAAINTAAADAVDVAPLVAALNEKTAAVAHEQTSLLDAADAPAGPAYEPTQVLESPAPDVGATALLDIPDYDPEIAEIFTEEAAEVLEAADASLASWSANRDASDLTELKRQLHTLKGGANMAGIRAFGNLSHELEALLIALDDQRVDADARIDALLRESFDRLHQMRDQVVAGLQPNVESALEERVRLATSGEAMPAAPTRGFRDDEMVEIPELDAGSDAVQVVEPTLAGDGELMDLGEIFGSATAASEDTDAADEAAAEADAPQAESVDDAAAADHGDAASALSATTAGDTTAVVDDRGDDVFVDGDATLVSEPHDAQEPDAADAHGWDGDATLVAGAAASTADADDETVISDAVQTEPAAAADNVVRVQPEQWSRETGVVEDAPARDETAATGRQPIANIDNDELFGSSDSLIEQSQILEALIDDAAASFASRAETEAQAGHDEAESDVEQAQGDAPELEETVQVDAAAAAGDDGDMDAVDAEAETDVVDLPQPSLPSRDVSHDKKEFARVDAKLLEEMLNAAGEISIYHGRLAQQVSSIEFHLAELDQTVTRLRDQLRQMDIETEAQILTRHEADRGREDFDPLELDRYSKIQQLSRALAETSNDVDSLKGLLQSVTTEADTLLTQQSRVAAELQGNLMRTRMVPFDRHVARLARIVRQAAAEAGKQAELAVEGASGELDRQVLEKMLPPLEHMMRNAVVHGIESVAERQAAGKPPMGQITIRLHREGSEMVIDVADDGAGLNVEAIRRKGIERGLLDAHEQASDDAILELILEPGFSTAEQLTQAAGRGVGMDVVANEVKRLGGSLRISSLPQQGTNFTIRLPFTLAITQALVVRAGDEVFALPLPTVEGVTRLSRAEVNALLAAPEQTFEYAEHSYRLQHLAPLVGGKQAVVTEDDNAAVSIILIRAGQFSTALLVDEMLASREIVVKSVGPQIASIVGVSGATILGDGSVVLILDMPSLVREQQRGGSVPAAAEDIAQDPLVMVVDDSITVRRVTERFLLRNDYRVVTAKDGLDAVSVIQEHHPDVILLDIEMPRMDGFEFATHVRNDPRFENIPIIMITSRTGEKHKARAIEIGVNDYLGKPYQDRQLLEAIGNQLSSQRRQA